MQYFRILSAERTHPFYIGFILQAGNGVLSIDLPLHDNDDCFSHFGQQILDHTLVPFTYTAKFSAVYRYGRRRDKGGIYFEMEVGTEEASGHPYISLHLLDHRTKDRCQFHIRTTAAGMLALGKLLVAWDPRGNKKLEVILPAAS